MNGKPIECIKSHSITFLLLQIDQINLGIIQGSVNVLIKIGIEEESAKKEHSRLIGHWESTWLYYFLIQDILL